MSQSSETSLPTTMKTAFIRIAAKNEVQQESDYHNYNVGEIVEYTLDDIVSTLEEWAETKNMTYYVIQHEPERECNFAHFHVVLNFKGIATKGDLVKRKFPFGYITPCRRKIKDCVQYLVHMNDDSKIQYDWDKVIHNDDKGLERFKTKKKINAFDVFLNKIANGEIREYQIPDFIDGATYAKKKRQIDNAVLYYINKQVQNPERNWYNRVRTIVIQGEARTGKTDFAKAYCDFLNKSYFVSGSDNDPWEYYQGQDCAILDDFRDNYYKLSTAIKMLDPFNVTPIHSRYHNVLFLGDLIIITTNKKIWDFYSRVVDFESKRAFMSRIELIIDMKEKDGEKVFNLIKFDETMNWFIRHKKDYKYKLYKDYDEEARERIKIYQEFEGAFRNIRILIGLMDEENINNLDPVITSDVKVDENLSIPFKSLDLSSAMKNYEIMYLGDVYAFWHELEEYYKAKEQHEFNIANQTALREKLKEVITSNIFGKLFDTSHIVIKEEKMDAIINQVLDIVKERNKEEPDPESVF